MNRASWPDSPSIRFPLGATREFFGDPFDAVTEGGGEYMFCRFAALLPGYDRSVAETHVQQSLRFIEDHVVIFNET